MIQLSAVIITFNEEKNIERCLKSLLPVADEIVVLDSFSTDATEEICKRYGVKFFKQKFAGYVEQKNDVLKFASFHYRLSLDADEALSDELTQSILELKKNWKDDAYSFNRLTNYCGQWIRHCGWYPDRKVRLFTADAGSWKGEDIHEKFELNPGKTKSHVNGDLLHYSYYTVAEHEKQLIKYANIAASAMYRQRISSSPFKIFYKSKFKFFRDYIIKLGILDGKNGFIISKNQSHGVYLKYKILFDLIRENNQPKK